MLKPQPHRQVPVWTAHGEDGGVGGGWEPAGEGRPDGEAQRNAGGTRQMESPGGGGALCAARATLAVIWTIFEVIFSWARF